MVASFPKKSARPPALATAAGSPGSDAYPMALPSKRVVPQAPSTAATSFARSSAGAENARLFQLFTSAGLQVAGRVMTSRRSPATSVCGSWS